MRDLVEQGPSERDEEIFTAWQGGKTLRVCAREFGVSVIEIERAIDRCLPIFNSATQMRAYKRELQRLEDIGTKYHALAMADSNSTEFAHIFARLNERICAMNGWTSVSIRMDPLAAQAAQQPTRFDKIYNAIMQIGPQPPSIGNDAALAPPTVPSAPDPDL